MGNKINVLSWKGGEGVGRSHTNYTRARGRNTKLSKKSGVWGVWLDSASHVC